MAITYTIPHVPLLDQLNEPTVDGRPDENARMNCVFTSNAAYATAVLGRPYYGDQLKDMDPSYGQGYTGGASEANLVDTMAKLGIAVTRVAHPTQQQLIDEIHHHVPQGHGVILTMPSQWNSAVVDPTTGRVRAGWNPRTYSGPTHVGLACGVGPGMIRVMNPWKATTYGWQDQSDSWWSLRLLKGEVWVLQPAAKGATTVVSGGGGVPSGWRDDGKTLIAPNGVPVVRGFRAYVLSHEWAANNWPLKPEAFCQQIEPGNAAMGKGARQDFRMTSLGCQQHADGSWGSPYVIYVGQDILALEQQLAAALAHVAQLEQQLADAQQQPPAPAPQPAPAPDPKASEALAALVELAKALKLVEPAA